MSLRDILLSRRPNLIGFKEFRAQWNSNHNLIGPGDLKKPVCPTCKGFSFLPQPKWCEPCTGKGVVGEKVVKDYYELKKREYQIALRVWKNNMKMLSAAMNRLSDRQAALITSLVEEPPVKRKLKTNQSISKIDHNAN